MRFGRASAALALAAIAGSALAGARAPLRALSTLRPGLWQLDLDEGEARSLCVADPGVLLQLKHGGAACSRLVIADAPDSVTVHYSCPGQGWGRTTIRVVSGRTLHLDTQGIAGNLPFGFAGEGRRIGDCPSGGR